MQSGWLRFLNNSSTTLLISAMLCSISADKPGPTWLDRLRSSKGLPTTGEDDLSLDHFLHRNHHVHPEVSIAPPNNGASDSTRSTTPSQSDHERVEIPSEGKGEDRDGEWCGAMSNVLSELFYIGGRDRSSTISGKKFPRKQTNPRHCSVQTPNNLPEQEEGEAKRLLGVREAESSLAATASLNSNNKKLEETRERRKYRLDCGEEEEEEKGEKVLVGYSRSEVTVIDTSSEVWKFETLVFRRKNVWKVRDKKGKSRVVRKRKNNRKSNAGDDSVGRNKKMKFSTSRLDDVHTPNPQSQTEEIPEEIENGISHNPERLLLKSRKEKHVHRQKL